MKQRKQRHLRHGSVAALCLVGFVVACSGGDRPGAAGSSSGAPAFDASIDSNRDDASAADAAPDGSDAGSICFGAAQQQTTPIDEIIVSGDPPPALGGMIAPGTYVLSELDFYGVIPGGAQDGVTGNAGRSTLVITADTMQIVGARGSSTAGLPADTVVGSTYTIMGTSLSTRSVCPVSGATKSIPYSAVGGGLALFVDARHREIYARK